MDSLTVPGVLDSLGAIADYIKTAATTAGLEKKAMYKLRLAVDEIATNIITHGYEESGLVGDITLHAEIDPAQLKIVIADLAAPYDPTKRELPDADDLSQDLSDRPIGGLGVYLAFEGVDSYTYERVNGHNHNILVVKRA